MLQKVKLSQFGGINTVIDSPNAGVSEARTCQNWLLRPVGGLSLPSAFRSFSPAGTALDLGYVTTIHYLWDTGAKLYLQSPDLNWWDVTPEPDGVPNNTPVVYAGATLGANLSIGAAEVLAFKQSTTLYWQMQGDESAMGWSTTRLGFVPYLGTVATFTGIRAFLSGFGPVFADGNGNNWKLQADNDVGLIAVAV